MTSPLRRAPGRLLPSDGDAGLTFTELLVALAILAALASLVIPVVSVDQAEVTDAALRADMSLGARLVQMGLNDGSMSVLSTSVPSDVPNVGAFSTNAQLRVKVTTSATTGQDTTFCLRGALDGEVLYWLSATHKFSTYPPDGDVCPTASDFSGPAS